jgi:hypothetical protein
MRTTWAFSVSWGVTWPRTLAIACHGVLNVAVAGIVAFCAASGPCRPSIVTVPSSLCLIADL